MGHGGTLDPFATGLLMILVGRGVKLARYFLGSQKAYEARFRFGETTIPGDPTEAVSETSEHIPPSIEELRELAHKFTLEPYAQTPPMHSAKKKDGIALYKLARAGIEVERQPKVCHLYEFQIVEYSPPRGTLVLKCSSGTYVRTLLQDFSKKLGTVGLLETLHRNASGIFSVDRAWTIQQLAEAGTDWESLPCWVPFDRLLDGFDRAEATQEEATALLHGKQSVLPGLLQKSNLSPLSECVAIYSSKQLVAVARKENHLWGIERVFSDT